MNKKEKLHIVKASGMAYVVSSTIAWLRAGGIEFSESAGSWTIQIHKTLGVIDVFRFEGHLQHMDILGIEGFLLLVGMGSGIAAAGIMAFVNWLNQESRSDKPEKTSSGYKVKIKRGST